ncbi:MAG: DUF6503 family protein [Gemmatimonadota bacterium]
MGSLLGASACAVSSDSPTAIVDAAIAQHGGDLFENSRIRFTFRGTRFEYFRDGGAFRYERTFRDPLGSVVNEVMVNDGTRRLENGGAVALADDERMQVEYDVNSVIYFGFLPFRLRDPAARLQTLARDTVQGAPYHRIEVTFDAEGGGVDSDVRFVHWIHQDSLTLDYFGYRYSRDGGGVRFRRAVNRREIGGILVQDFENYAPADAVEDIADLAQHFEEGSLDLLSLVALEEVEVTRARGLAEVDPLLPREAPGEGLELQLGIERSEYSPGDSIHAVMNLVNRSGEERALGFASAQRFDLVVLDEGGEPQARWSEGQLFAQVTGEEALAPGGTLHFESSVTAPAAPGSYYLQGSLPASGAPLPAVLPFRVVP